MMKTNNNFMSESLNYCFNLNSECLDLQKKLNSLATYVSPNEVEYCRVKSLTFKKVGIISNDNIVTLQNDSDSEEEEKENKEAYQEIYLLKQHGEKAREKIENFEECFYDFKNPLRTPLPKGYIFDDLIEELKVYQLLDDTRGMETVDGLRKGLEKVRDTLKESVQNIQKRIGVGLEALQKVMSASEKEKYYKFSSKDQGYLKGIRFEFTLELGHERALRDVENLFSVIENYFEELKSESKENSNESSIIESIQTKRIKKKEKKNRMNEPFMNESTIIVDNEHRTQLQKWMYDVRPDSKTQPQLLFRASSHSFSAQKFHNICDNKGPTLTVIKTKNSRICGGYLNLSWNSNSAYLFDNDKKSFLFRLTNVNDVNQPQIFPLVNSKMFPTQGPKTMFGNPQWGPVFGEAELAISSDCNSSSSSYSTPLKGFSIPSSDYLTGSTHFIVSEYEVWKID